MGFGVVFVQLYGGCERVERGSFGTRSCFVMTRRAAQLQHVVKFRHAQPVKIRGVIWLAHGCLLKNFTGSRKAFAIPSLKCGVEFSDARQRGRQVGGNVRAQR